MYRLLDTISVSLCTYIMNSCAWQCIFKHCLQRRSNVHGRTEKTNWLPGPAQPMILPEAKNCEPVHSPPLDYRTVNLECLVLLTVDGNYCSQQLIACHIQAEAVCVGEDLTLYSFSTWIAMLS